MKSFSINLILLCLAISVSAKDKPNIIILLADDLGWADLGYQGSDDIRSPHIDKLANSGIRFTDGHVSARYAVRHGPV
jgi:arylsulfatase A-like enzyme